MTSEDNKTIFRRFYEGVWNTGDLSLVEEFLAPAFVNHEITDSPVAHRDLYTQAVVETRTAFPDFTLTIEDVIAEGDKVAGRWRWRCSQVETGKRIVNTGITIVRVADGKITDFWKRDDALSVRRQLGNSAMPSST